MISIGVVSDSHKNIENLKKAITYLTNEKQINLLVHLGDFYEDLEDAVDLTGNLTIMRVPGTQNYRYNDPSTIKRIKTRIENIDFLLSHVPRKHQTDLVTDTQIEDSIKNKSMQVLLYGHTHQYEIFYNNLTDILYINPGHLKDSDEQGTPPTFAHIIADKNRIIIKILNLVNEIMLEKRYIL